VPDPVPDPVPDLRVLVVDDDFMVASIHSRFVSRVEGFTVVGQAATAATALSEADRLSPDLVLLDVHLPDRSGIEVLRALRAAGNDVGVVMVTAAREADTVRAAAAGGAAHYLVKPFEFDDLATRLAAFRQSWLALRELGTPDQDDIDAVFAPLGRGRTALPKGLSPETAEAVRAALAAADDLSAAECAEAVGVSRVSARRYLEHFVAEGSASVRLRYGGAGRPERRYSSA
jgi:response regulator of citrate/malate metabolism